MSKKKVTLYPDDRKSSYSEFEDFLLVNRQLIILIIIIIVLFSFFIGCMLYIDYFRAEHTYNALKIIGGYYI